MARQWEELGALSVDFIYEWGSSIYISGSSGSAVDRLLFALTKLIAGSYALMYIKMARLAREQWISVMCVSIFSTYKINISLCNCRYKV